MKQVRSYAKVVDRIIKATARSADLTPTVLGEIKAGPTHYPLYRLSLSSSSADKGAKGLVCLSAGIHGDEPAGVEAVLTLLENPGIYRPFLAHFDFILFPCINPYGYEHNTRTNGQKLDLNRQFDKKRPPKEVVLVRSILEKNQFSLSLEFHEDVDTDGFYLYELKRQAPYFGEIIIKEVAKHCPINHREEIESLPSQGGIIRRPVEQVLELRKKDWPQAIFQIQKSTPHTMTFETPTTLPLKDRAHIHLTAFATAHRALLTTLPVRSSPNTENDHLSSSGLPRKKPCT